ncbi:unnamed protein product [Amoebophrya sp. A25]|nr:unnamed protein product [Amoebophrya sp. A25]|eukprot:GSA25T00020354001.1
MCLEETKCSVVRRQQSLSQEVHFLILVSYFFLSIADSVSADFRMRQFVGVVSFAAGAAAMTSLELAQQNLKENDAIIALSDEKKQDENTEIAFEKAYSEILASFNVDDYKQQAEQISFLAASPTFTSKMAAAPHCNYGVSPAKAATVKGAAAFPGGIVARLFGGDLSQLVSKLAPQGRGTAEVLAGQGLATGAGLIQSAMSTLLSVAPPLIGAPAWINQPLPCMPLATASNCGGSVLYPITAADFAMADVTDRQLDGTIADFPRFYRKTVGKTSDAAYKACFAAYMGMQCASVFPRCAVPLAREEPGPTGRLPLCFTSCLLTMTSCPGMWISDMKDECSMVSAPPACSMAVFHNLSKMPPQYTTFEESVGTQMECPTAPAWLSGDSALTDATLYSAAGEKIPTSPYAAAASAMPHAL